MTARRQVLREAVMAHASTRAAAEALVEAILEEICDLDDDGPAPESVAGVHIQELSRMSVGELRARLRLTREEIAARDGC